MAHVLPYWDITRHMPYGDSIDHVGIRTSEAPGQRSLNVMGLVLGAL